MEPAFAIVGQDAGLGAASLGLLLLLVAGTLVVALPGPLSRCLFVVLVAAGFRLLMAPIMPL